MLRFRLFGFPVTVEPWHWAILAFIGGGLRIRDKEDLLPVILFMVAGFVSILIHELGHAFMSRLFGCRHVAIVLHGAGGVAISQGARFNRGQDILVSAAGPGLQAFCGGVTLVLFLTGIIPGGPATNLPGTPPTNLVDIFVGVSLIWALINLIPVYPLDGGQILQNILGPRRIQLTLAISIVAAVIIGGWLVLNGYYLFAIFLGFFTWQNYKMLSQLGANRGW